MVTLFCNVTGIWNYIYEYLHLWLHYQISRFGTVPAQTPHFPRHALIWPELWNLTCQSLRHLKLCSIWLSGGVSKNPMKSPYLVVQGYANFHNSMDDNFSNICIPLCTRIGFCGELNLNACNVYHTCISYAVSLYTSLNFSLNYCTRKYWNSSYLLVLWGQEARTESHFLPLVAAHSNSLMW